MLDLVNLSQPPGASAEDWDEAARLGVGCFCYFHDLIDSSPRQALTVQMGRWELLGTARRFLTQ